MAKWNLNLLSKLQFNQIYKLNLKSQDLYGIMTEWDEILKMSFENNK